MKNDKVIDLLDDLLTRITDSAKGYTEAGNGVRYVQLRKLFFDYAEQRESMQEQLQTLITKYGGEREEDPSGSFLGGAHRVWLEFQAQINEHQAEDVLEECVRGEERALEDYDQVLEDYNLPADVHAVIENQRNAIDAAKKQMLKLEAQYDVIED